MARNRVLIVSGLVSIAVGLVLILAFLQSQTKPAISPALSQASGPTTEPLIPTRTRAPQNSTTAVTRPTSAGGTPTSRPALSDPAGLWRGRPRWGVGVAVGSIWRYDVTELSLGWYLDWQTALNAPKRDGIEFVQMIRLRSGDLEPDETAIAEIARANPGSIWMIGNEPDVKWQDNVEPAAYARLYHRAFSAIKHADSTALVAIGGVTQPTPLRMRYLDQVLQAYRHQNSVEMPVDVWNIHNFILREERGSWGVDIPPGLSDDTGMLYQVADNASLELFQRQIIDFRQWMLARGYQNYPLIVSEYGIPMPEDYGFPPDKVGAFLVGTFDFFQSARDLRTGDPADEYRLVQRWCWYSLADTGYPTGNLFDPTNLQMTPLGQTWRAYVKR